ncbi:hypothetical protein BC828DRAFT_378962 [Blastocladiella britannica]|nr:hypothetical protein BC828DRAFT_378962 [Blastocladiella britannica]
MSNSTYTAAWRDLSAMLFQQQEYENPSDPLLIPKDRESALAHLHSLYANYVRAFRTLERTHDQMLQPQKRRLLRDLLMALSGRILEIRVQLYEIDATDFPDLDPILFDLKIGPEDLLLPVPQCFAEERAAILKERTMMLVSKNAKTLAIDSKVAFPELSLDQAVALLQRNERGRQGRIRAKYMRDIKQQEDQDADMDTLHDVSELSTNVLKIQRVWRGHKARQRVKIEARRDAEFLGLEQLPVYTQRSLAAANAKQRKERQAQHEEEYQQALITIKDKIRKVEGPDMKESYQDAFRQWYMDAKREQGKFPDFPTDEEWKLASFKFGQSLAAGNADAATSGTRTAGSAGADKKGAAATGKKPASAGKDKAAAGKGGKDSKGGKKGDAAEEPEQLLVNVSSAYLARIQARQGEYVKDWRDKNEADNFAQRHDVEIIKVAKRGEVDTEVKDELFGMLKEELENLKLAMEKDGKKKKKDGGKKKKKDKKGGKKGKKEKDLTNGRPLEELIDELVAAGLMVRPMETRLSDYKAVPGLVSKEKLNPEPSTLDIKRMLTEYCILPLGMDDADDAVLPAPPKSVLLYGAAGCGKSTLCNIVATEAGAAVFVLSPKVTAGQYVGKANVARMVYTVFKVAKAVAPSIVVVDDAEAVYCKKVPKEDTSDPKRARKDLTKAINALKPSDRVLVLGMSRNPFYSDAKALSDAFHRTIHVARPNYAAREAMWREWIADYTVQGSSAVSQEARNVVLASIQHVNSSVLARVSAGYSGAMIQAIVRRAITPRRCRQLTRKELQAEELVRPLLMLPEPDRKVEQDFRDWTLKLPIFKKREIVLGLVQEEDPADAKGKGKGGKDAAKKKK